MEYESAFLLFGFVVVAAYAVQTATGFGAMLVCVTFGAQLIGLEEVIRLMVPLSFLQTGYIVIRDHITRSTNDDSGWRSWRSSSLLQSP